jgi:hypothetical protein
VRLELDTPHVKAVLIEKLPALQIDRIKAAAGNRYVEHRQSALADLLLHVHQSAKQHSLYCEAVSLPSRMLRERLKVRDNFHALLNPFFSVEQGNRGYSYSDGVTKAWRLRPEVRSAIEAASADYSGPYPVLQVSEDGERTPAGGTCQAQ